MKADGERFQAMQGRDDFKSLSAESLRFLLTSMYFYLIEASNSILMILIML